MNKYFSYHTLYGGPLFYSRKNGWGAVNGEMGWDDYVIENQSRTMLCVQTWQKHYFNVAVTRNNVRKKEWMTQTICICAWIYNMYVHIREYWMSRDALFNYDF